LLGLFTGHFDLIRCVLFGFKYFSSSRKSSQFFHKPHVFFTCSQDVVTDPVESSWKSREYPAQNPAGYLLSENQFVPIVSISSDVDWILFDDVSYWMRPEFSGENRPKSGGKETTGT
jgi:hypothetical protein